MRIVTVNLKHSANLGDQLISECLLSELKAIDPALSLVSADLAGGTGPDKAPATGYLRYRC